MKFEELHPVVLSVYYMILLLYVCLMNDLRITALILVALHIVNYYYGQHKVRFKTIFLLLFSCFSIVMINLLFVKSGTTVLFKFGERNFTLEALVYGLTITLLMLNIFAIFTSFNRFLNGRRFIYLFSKTFPQLGLYVYLTMRFIPLFIERLKEIESVQRTKGISMKEGNIRARMKSGMRLLHILLIWSLNEAIDTADSMKCRGYGVLKRKQYNHYPFTAIDGATIIFIMLINVLVIKGYVGGSGKLLVYPTIELQAFTASDYATTCLVAVLILFPLIVEGVHKAKWAYLK